MVAIDLITEHIRMKLQQHDLRRIYPNLEVIPSNFQVHGSFCIILKQQLGFGGTLQHCIPALPRSPQIRGMHTIIRDADSHKADFVFYADRLLRLV